MRTCIIFNPLARGEKARRFRQHLKDIASQAVLKLTTEAGSARLLAAEAVHEGFDAIIAAGGDGTVNEVVNGIGDVPDGLERIRFGVLPLGTVNVFAMEHGVPFSLIRAWECIQSGQEIRIDLPRIEWAANGPCRGRYFVQMAGAGLDARAIELVSWALKKRIGQFAYVLAGLKAAREKPSEILVRSGSRPLKGALVLIGNGRYYAGVPLFEGAQCKDGMLDICVFPRVNWRVLFRYACAYMAGRVLWPGEEQRFQTPSLQLESAQPVPMELDGEVAGHLPASCEISKRSLHVLAPRSRPSRQRN